MEQRLFSFSQIQKNKKYIAMTLVKFKPSVANFDSLLDSFFPMTYGAPRLQSPSTNVVETKENFIIEMNVPGRNKEDFNIQVENDLLTISFEKKEEKMEEDRKYIRKEFSFQNFKRTFSLDDTIDASKIEAKYDNGILIIELPKKEDKKEFTRQISIS